MFALAHKAQQCSVDPCVDHLTTLCQLQALFNVVLFENILIRGEFKSVGRKEAVWQ
jgi:hypothetical protein